MNVLRLAVGPLGLSLLALALVGCQTSTQLTMEAAVPEALVEASGSSVGLMLTPALTSHVYAEDTRERPDWRIESGAAQAAMFQKVLASLFSSITPVDAPSAALPVVVPEIVEMQFATPEESGLAFFEAWVKYRLVLYRVGGEPAESYEFTAYGKAEDGFFISQNQGFRNALDEALRFAGARLATGFPASEAWTAWLAKGE